MPTFEEILRIHHLQRVELQAWIEQRWVRPLTTAQGPVFDEADEARITLIRELRQELMVSDDALEVVLSLLDQLYATRRVLKRVEEAVAALPEPLRAQIRARLRPSDSSA
jgi:chaperone modulatory protein CbpM